MKTLQTNKSIFALIFAVLILTVLVSCGGSSTNTAISDTGRVSLLITDGPSNDFDQINITLESISFLCEDGDASCSEVILFEETRVINLLALQNYSDLLSTTTVSAGTYSKIRLEVSKVELVKLDIDGMVLSTDPAKLSSGKIDLNPQVSFDVVGGDDLVIELDMDAEKSIHIVETGNGKFIFRPVIFVNILGEEELKLVILEDRKVLATDTGFQLCEMEVVEVNDECLELLTSDNTVIQDKQIDVVIPPEDIEDNDIVAVLGKLGHGSINALHIVIAADAIELHNHALFTGKATSPVAVDASFGMETDNDNDLVTPGTALTVTLAPSSRVFDKYGSEVARDNIKVDISDLDVFGLAQPEIAIVTDVKAAFAIVNNDILDDNISGAIVDITGSEITIEIDNESSITFECADVADAKLFLLETVAGNISSEQTTINQLLVGMSVDVYGEYGASSCLSADVVLVTALPLP